MTVAELIEALQDMPWEWPVAFFDTDRLVEVSDVSAGDEHDNRVLLA